MMKILKEQKNKNKNLIKLKKIKKILIRKKIFKKNQKKTSKELGKKIQEKKKLNNQIFMVKEMII